MKKYKIFIIVVAISFFTSACEYAFLAPEELPPIDGGNGNGVEVSFATDVLPIFENRCASCHKSGGPDPILTGSAAYQSINNSKYINLDSPESSLIYSYVAPGASTHTHRQYSAAQAQYVLVWIQQGAENN